jgi:cytochrome c oxidase subunit IV
MEHSKMNQPPGKPFPDEQDYHGHPDYAKVFLWLLFFLGVSLLVGYVFSSPKLTISLIFLTAGIKAILVVKNFMHLKYEPVLVLVAVLVVLFILLSFFFGVFPDIVPVLRELVN